MRTYALFVCLVAGFAGGMAQPARVGGSGERTLVTVPMTGTGTWADPRRPVGMREAGMAFRYQVSDDGGTAIVEVTARNAVEMGKLEAEWKRDSRVKVYRPSKDKEADVVAEIRKLKKDFDIDSFGKGAGAGK